MNNFTKAQKLLNKRQFDHVFEQSKRIFCGEFLILYRPNMCQQARLGFIISKKNVKNATSRNKFKRLVRESFRVSDLSGVDIIFLARKGLDKLSNQDIVNKISKVWQKIAS